MAHNVEHHPTRFNGFWSPSTATLDWCEENYHHTPYIAEFCKSNVLHLSFHSFREYRVQLGIHFERVLRRATVSAGAQSCACEVRLDVFLDGRHWNRLTPFPRHPPLLHAVDGRDSDALFQLSNALRPVSQCDHNY